MTGLRAEARVAGGLVLAPVIGEVASFHYHAPPTHVLSQRIKGAAP